MAWSGYYFYAGTEIINASRTEAYARNLNVGWFKPVYNETELAWLLGEPQYATPLQDDAPWTDPDNLDSYDFYGVYPLEVTGVEDATVSAEVTESVIDGGYIGRVRRSTKTVVFNAVLTGASECAVEYGFRWLRTVLNGQPCFNQAYGVCGGYDLCYLACPPVMGDPTPTQSPGEIVLDNTNLARNPSLESGSTNGWITNNVASWVLTASQVSPISGAYSAMTVRQAANPSFDAGSIYVSATDGTPFAPSPGESVTAALDIRCEQPNRTVGAYIQFYDAAWNGTGNTSLVYVPLTNGEAKRVKVTGVVPPGTVWTLPIFIVSDSTYVNAPVGERVWYDNLYFGSDPSGDYFDGSTPAKGDYSYAWTDTPNASTSQRSVQTYVADPLPTAEDCYEKVGRSLHEVTTTNGPTVTKKLEMINGGSAWTVTWTMIAANPAEFGIEKPLVVGFLDPTVDDPYVGGLPEGAVLDEDGNVQTDPYCPVVEYKPVYDPTCTLLVPPPDVPSVVPKCFNFPVNYLRRSFTVPRESIPLWTEVVPVVSLTTKTVEARNVRLRFYADVFDTGNPSNDPCNFCGDVVFSYIPTSSTIVLDGTNRQVYIDTPGIGRRRADSLVSDSSGNPFDWPIFSCGFGYVVTVDMPQQQQSPPVVDLALVPRML